MNIYHFIRKSFPIQFNHFVASTPVPGLKFLNCYEHKCQKIFWYVVFGFNLLVVLAVNMKFWNQYQKWSILPVYQDLEQGIWLPYPAVYLCLRSPLSPLGLAKYRKNFLKSNLTMSIADIDYTLQLMLRFQRSTFNVSYKLHELFNNNIDMNLLQENLPNLYYKIDELFKDCSFQGLHMDCNEIFMPIETALGRCFVFNSIYTDNRFHDDPLRVSYKEFSEFDEDWTLRFKLVYEVDTILLIYLLHPQNLITLADYATFIWMPRKPVAEYGFSIVDYYYNEETRSPIKESERLCLNPDGTFTDKDMRAEFKANFYNRGVCLNYCHALKFMEMCNCLPTFGQTIFPKLANSTQMRICGFNDMECYENNYLSVRRTDCEECLLGCRNTIYITEPDLSKLVRSEEDNFINPPAMQTDYTEFIIDLDYWPPFHFKILNIFNSSEFMLALASTASLFLGTSILTIVEAFYNLFIRLPYSYFVNKDYFVRAIKTVRKWNE